MNTLLLNTVLLAADATKAEETPPASPGLPAWQIILIAFIAIVLVGVWAKRFLGSKSSNGGNQNSGSSGRARQETAHLGGTRHATRPATTPRANISQLGETQSPPTPPQTDGPVHTPVGHAQAIPPARQGMKVVEEWSGDAALRGDFVDIMGALGKKLDKVIAETRVNAELVADLKRENQRLIEEKKGLMDLLQNEQHKRLLNNLIKATSLCERYIRHIKDNPEAIQALEFVRDECRDRLADAGLKPYSPKVGDRLADLDGTLLDPPAKTLPTEDPSKGDTVAEVLTVGYYYERDGKKMPVAKASAVFYRSSSTSNPTPSN